MITKVLAGWIAVCVATAFAGQAAAADGILIPATMPRDAAYDSRHDTVYISEGTKVLRYQLGSGQFLAPIDFGVEGYVYGISLSADDRTLAVAHSRHTAAAFGFSLVDTDTLAITERTFPVLPSTQEFGTFSIALAADGSAYTTSSSFLSGAMPLRRTAAGTGATTTLLSAQDQSVVSASGDGKFVIVGQPLSDGRWARYNTATGQLVSRDFSNGTGGYVFDVGLDRTGAQAAVLDAMGAHVYDAAYALKGVIGASDAAPLGVAYHPVEALAYFPIQRTTLVRVYDMTNLSLVTAYDTGFYFPYPGRSSYPTGRTRLSSDGSLLMVTVEDGVRAIRTYDGLSAAAVSVATAPGAPITFPLAGHIGIPGDLAYSVPASPAHGSVTLASNQLTYRPQAGFTGIDTFTYQVRYGRAVATGTITVTVQQRPPVVADDRFAMTLNKPALIRVLDNDSDPEGDALSLVSISGGGPGRAEIAANAIRYTPPAKAYGGSAVYTYVVSDGHGGSSSGTLVVDLPRFVRTPPPTLLSQPDTLLKPKPPLPSLPAPSLQPKPSSEPAVPWLSWLRSVVSWFRAEPIDGAAQKRPVRAGRRN